METSDCHKKTAVIKIGTDVLTTPEGKLDREMVKKLSAQIANLRARYQRLLVVTSGAAAAGREALGEKKRKEETLADKQAFTAVGQPLLMDAWNYHLGKEGLRGAQLLLTREDFCHPSRLRNILTTQANISERWNNVITLINENDPVATVELKLGDNDILGGLVARAFRADVCLILTGKNGLLKNVDDPDSAIGNVDVAEEDVSRYVVPGSSVNGSGGMETKVKVAADLAARGIDTVIAGGKVEKSAERILIGREALGTRFSSSRPKRKKGSFAQ